MTRMGIGNGFDPKVVKRWTGEVLRVHEEIEKLRVDHMNRCREVRERLPDIYESAKEAGLPKKAFRSHIRVELAKLAYERACEKAVPDDEEDREAFEQLRAMSSPGDLFDAAVKAHDDDADLRPRHLRDLEQQRVEENTRRLQEGISGLPGADANEA